MSSLQGYLCFVYHGWGRKRKKETEKKSKIDVTNSDRCKNKKVRREARKDG